VHSELIKHPATFVWALLMAATGLSWWLGADDAKNAGNMQTVTEMLMLIAFVKVRFVIHYFMEIRHAPVALRMACDVWVVAVGGSLIGLYWYTGS
jgi:hypothetical protein